jgi:AraC-like DNA-binding protein
MDEPLAHYVVVRAMEERAGVSAANRFALAIRHAVVGHMPHPRYREAATQRRRSGAGHDSVLRSIADWIATDLNPVVRSISSLRSHANAMWGYNAYNLHARLGARTSFDFVGAEPSATVRMARRERMTTADDPELCAVGTWTALEHALSIVSHNQVRAAPRSPGILDVGRLLGVESSAAFHVVEAMAAHDRAGLDGIARHLGSSRRSLQRKLAEESTGFEAIRSAVRIVRVTDALRGDAPLAEIAWHVGFSDVPHMSRAIKVSCGMSPGLLRAILRGGATPELDIAVPSSGIPKESGRDGSEHVVLPEATISSGPARSLASERRAR